MYYLKLKGNHYQMGVKRGIIVKKEKLHFRFIIYRAEGNPRKKKYITDRRLHDMKFGMS